MKTAVIFCEGIKQIVFTPETPEEKYALSLISPSDDIELLVERGSFGDQHNKPFTRTVSECSGGWLRVYHESESRILVLKPKAKSVAEIIAE